MQTRKEVDNMHAALIRSRAANALVAALAALALATAIAPMVGYDNDDQPNPAVMPGGICPPNC